MKIINPKTEQDFSSRNMLLQEELRDSQSQLKIIDEYPYLLSKKAYLNSFCVVHNNTIVAHANMQEREVQKKDGSKYKIALIANVATAKNMQKKGIMNKLLEHLSIIATERSIKGVFLWSDLDGFYKKCNFLPIGSESLIGFAKSDFRYTPGVEIIHLNPDEMSKKNINTYIKNFDAPIDYVVKDKILFRQRLKIPELNMFGTTHNKSYFLIGKGSDFQGVVHDWYCENGDEILSLVNYVFKNFEINDLILLSSKYTDARFLNELQANNATVEKQKMAFCKVLDSTYQDNLNELFIWGMDSI